MKLLDRAYTLITPRIQRRQEIPKLSIQVQPKKTIIQNFRDVAQRLNRDPTHIARFFLKELALPGNIEGNTFVLYARGAQGLLRLFTSDISSSTLSALCAIQ